MIGHCPVLPSCWGATVPCDGRRIARRTEGTAQEPWAPGYWTLCPSRAAVNPPLVPLPRTVRPYPRASCSILWVLTRCPRGLDLTQATDLARASVWLTAGPTARGVCECTHVRRDSGAGPIRPTMLAQPNLLNRTECSRKSRTGSDGDSGCQEGHGAPGHRARPYAGIAHRG